MTSSASNNKPTITSSTSNSKPYDDKLHFVIVPFMAQGHMIPLIDIARLLAQRDVTVTVITTPHYAAKFKNADVTRDVIIPIHVVEVKFPFEKAGLPQGCESVDMLDSMSETLKFFEGAQMMEDEIEEAMKKMENPRPSCLIGDVSLPFTASIAAKLGIPKIVFHGFSSFCLLSIHLVRETRILSFIESEDEYFRVPGFPGEIEFTKPQVSTLQSVQGEFKELAERMIEADESAYGVIVNTFEELEVGYVGDHKKVKGGKVWCVGPVSLCNKLGVDRVERGDKAVIDQEQCLEWLDSQETGSVLYVCFGSICNLPEAQLKELGLGLEESGRPFVWVIRGGGKYNEIENWIMENRFEERVKGRGLVIRGWVPQVLILSHTSVGGFLTHCGWNSTLEGITAGVPLLTWPLFTDQFCNEKLVTQVLRVGSKIGVEKFMKWGEEDEIGVLVDKERVRKAVDEVMGDSEEAKERRRRAKELEKLANKAMEKGGSSYSNITLLIEDIMEQAQSKM